MNNTQKLDLILSKFDKIEDRLDKIEDKIKMLLDYKDKDNKIIEIEVKESIFNSLKEKDKSLIFIDVTKIFPKELKNQSGQKVAELDGLIIGTNNRLFASKYNKQFNLRNNILINKNQILNNNIYNFYIIEGKHNITKNKLEAKYKQFLKLKEYFKNLKNNINNYNINNYNLRYQNLISKFNLNLFNEDSIYLIIGGPFWTQDALYYYDKFLKDNDHIFKIELGSNRYKVNI